MKRVYRLAALQSHPIQYFAPLFRRLAREPEIDLTVFYCSRQGLQEYHDEGFGQQVKWDVPLLEGYRSRFLPNLRPQDEVAGFWSLANPRIISELHTGGYDALWMHGHSYATYLMAVGAAQARRLPIFMRCESHLLLQRSPLKRLLRRPMMSFFYRKLCRACLPIGTRNREFYRFHGVRSHRLFDVPYAVDNDFFLDATTRFDQDDESFREELGLPLDKPLILYASKLTQRKRPLDLLEAYRRLRDSDVQAALVFVGSGEQEEDLRKYVRHHNIADVFFFGFRNQTELPRFYALCDVFVLPSENEPWGLVINEVMSAGLPVIASYEVGATPDLVRHGDNGFVFPSGDVGALAAYLKAVLSDPEVRRKMGERSRSIISEWSFEQCVQGIKAALQALPSGQQRLPGHSDVPA